MRVRLAWFVPFLLFAACSSDHPLAGAWAQKLPAAAVGMTLEFEAGGTRVMVHLAPRADGSHGHLDEPVTYSFDATAKTLSVKGPLLGAGKADTWTGNVHGDQMELTSADGKLDFVRGTKVQGH